MSELGVLARLLRDDSCMSESRGCDCAAGSCKPAGWVGLLTLLICELCGSTSGGLWLMLSSFKSRVSLSLAGTPSISESEDSIAACAFTLPVKHRTYLHTIQLVSEWSRSCQPTMTKLVELEEQKTVLAECLHRRPQNTGLHTATLHTGKKLHKNICSQAMLSGEQGCVATHNSLVDQDGTDTARHYT